MLHCDLRLRWKAAGDLRFRAAISEPQTPSLCGISGDLAPSTQQSLAIAIVRFWCAKCRIVPVTPTPVCFQKYCRTNGGRTAVQRGGVLQYEWEAYCGVSLSSKLRSQESTAIQVGGVLLYKLEVYCRTFSTSEKGRGVTDRGVTAPKVLREFERFSVLGGSDVFSRKLC